MDEAVLNCWVTETNEIPFLSKSSIIRAKSSRDRERRSTLYTTTTSTSPDSMSASSLASAGRSMVPPENPPSS